MGTAWHVGMALLALFAPMALAWAIVRWSMRRSGRRLPD
jgi:hypothetical protein